MRLKIVLVSFLTCFAPLCLAAGDCARPVQAIPICNVLANAAQYDGKEVTVSGSYRMVIHGSILSGPACSKDDVNLRRAAHWKGDKHAVATIRSLTKQDRFQSVGVVSRGTFRVAQEGQCFGQNCLHYEIEETELLCATKIKTNALSISAHPKRVPPLTTQ